MNDSRLSVRKLAISDVEVWSQVSARQVFVSDIIDQGSEPDAKMTVGFARVGRGESMAISFPYDEVLVVTKGAYTVVPEHGNALTARAGEVIYLPGGSTNNAHADEDTEMVYVAGPPAVYADHVTATTSDVQAAK